MQLALFTVFWIIFALVIFTTVVPLTNSVQWWVRGWDFPRVQIAVVAAALAMIGLIIWTPATQLASLILLVCVGYQCFRVFPYTQLATPEIALKADVPEDEQVKVIAYNVLKENTDHAAVAALLDRHKPDVVFLMEIDDAWVDGLDGHLKKYKTVIRHPMDNHYGLIFATDLEVIAAEIVELADDAAPAILAELVGPTGPFFFVGLHPRPPVPGHTTIERDEQIKRAAQIADRSRLPVVAMGDFNDVAWSRSSERFKEYGEFRDPRVGRAMLPSFDARSWIMRFPIDQLYLTEGLDLVSFDRLEPVGSDHFPMSARFAVQQNQIAAD